MLPTGTFSVGSRCQSRSNGCNNSKRVVRRLESLPEVESLSPASTSTSTETKTPSSIQEPGVIKRVSHGDFTVTALLQHDDAIDRFHRPRIPEQSARLAVSNGHGHGHGHNQVVTKAAGEQCLPNTIGRFVEAVQSMNDTVLLPSRLINETELENSEESTEVAATTVCADNCCSCQCHQSNASQPDDNEMDKYSLFMLLNAVSRRLQHTSLTRSSEGHDRQLALLSEPLSSVDPRAVAKARQVCAQIAALEKTFGELTQAAQQVSNEYHAQSNPDRLK